MSSLYRNVTDFFIIYFLYLNLYLATLKWVDKLVLLLVLVVFLWIDVHFIWCWWLCCSNLPLLCLGISLEFYDSMFVIKGCWVMSYAFFFIKGVDLFFYFLCLYSGLYLLIFIYWTISTSLGWSLLRQGAPSLWYVLGFNLKISYWEFFHLWS